MKYRFLSIYFYEKYNHCNEILRKKDRPYMVFITTYQGIDFAIPFRSHIEHEHAFITDNKEKNIW